MTHRIAFVSIFDLTALYYEIAKKLERAGNEIYWITTNPAWTDWLVERGVARDRIQQLVYTPEDFVTAEEAAVLVEEIVRTERASGLTINQAMQMDQFVMFKNKPDINQYMLLYYRDLKRFLASNRITQVFAEPTNSNEVIMAMLCRELAIPFLSARDMRIPLGRIIFNEGHLQHRIVSGRRKPALVSGGDVITAFVKKKTTPSYFSQNSARPLDAKKLSKSIANRLRRRRYGKANLTHHDLSGRIRLALKRAVNSQYMKRLCRYDSLDDIKGKVCYYGLHVQPEASIDVMGSYFSDQLKLIKDIRRALPFDTTLVVKEHPNFLGIKPIAMFRQIRRLPNVKLVHHNVSSFELYQRSSLVVTVSGTTAYEAGLLGIPAVVFSPMYFDGLSSIRYCDDISKLKDIAAELLNNFKRDYEADCRFMEELIACSYPARWGNPLTNPDLFEPENIELLTEAFAGVLPKTAVETEPWESRRASVVLHDSP